MRIQTSSGCRLPAPRTAILVCLGVASLLGAALVAACRCDFAQTKEDAPPAHSAKFSAAPGSPPLARYLRTGQWRGDARTIAAAVRYLLEVEPPAKPGEALPTLELAMPTNSSELPAS